MTRMAARRQNNAAGRVPLGIVTTPSPSIRALGDAIESKTPTDRDAATAVELQGVRTHPNQPAPAAERTGRASIVNPAGADAPTLACRPPLAHHFSNHWEPFGAHCTLRLHHNQPTLQLPHRHRQRSLL